MSGRPIHLYRVHGLVVASELELPELAARRIAVGPPSDVHIRLGDVARPEGASTPAEPKFVVVPGGAFLEMPEVARFFVEAGRAVTVDPLPGAELELIRTILLSWTVAMVCLQRDLLVLHASAVAFGGHAVAFMGDQGAGKSTLAAYCVQAGAQLVADDLLRISLVDGGPPRAHPGMPLLKLWRHALDGLGRGLDGLVRQLWREDKFLVPFPRATAEVALPLDRVFVLAQDEAAGAARFERLTGAAAVTALITNSHGVGSLDVLGRRPGHFADCARLANGVEVVRLSRRRDPAQLPMTAGRIAEQCGRDR